MATAIVHELEQDADDEQAEAAYNAWLASFAPPSADEVALHAQAVAAENERDARITHALREFDALLTYACDWDAEAVALRTLVELEA